MKKLLSIILIFLIMFSFSFTSFASEPHMTVDEARAYLENYCVTEVNSVGKEYTTQYIFSSQDDLEKAAQYIADNGLEVFNTALAVAVDDVVGNETPIVPRPRTTTPTTAYKTVFGNGTHYVTAEAYGLASFDSLGTVEYLVELGYSVTVTKGVFTNLSNISFDIPYVSAAGSWGHTRFPSYYTDTVAGVTANYDITKTVEVSVGNFSFEIKSETDNEVFPLLTYVK